MRSQNNGILNGINVASPIGLVVAKWLVGIRCPEVSGAGTDPHSAMGLGPPFVVKNLASSGSFDDGKNGHVTKDPKMAPLLMRMSSCAPVRVGILVIAGNPIPRKKSS